MGEHPGRGRKEAWPDEALHTSMKRVKVYRLVDGGKWDDQGTGHVTIDYIEGSREFALTVVDEEDSDTLLLHHITPDDIYRKQEETIISWRDPEKALELALSFQEAAGCSYIWENMCNIQQELQLNIFGSHEVGSQPTLKSLEASRDSLSHDESLTCVNGELKKLPPLELSSLSMILKTILECSTTEQMRVAELISQDHDFFPKLVNLFRTCEGLKNMDDLHKIFRLVKAIILLNRSAIFDKIFSDDFILDITGALEYDPEVCNVQNHRAFLKEQAVFKEALPIRNASVVLKIHQTYRIQYIKDVILPRALDDATLASLNTIIHTNNAFIVCLLKDDASFIQELFAKMRSSNISAESKSELVLFLQEFCTLSKSLQPVQQIRLSRFAKGYFVPIMGQCSPLFCVLLLNLPSWMQTCPDYVHKDLTSQGVFDIISDVLHSQDKALVSAGTNILVHFLNQDPNLLRSYIARQAENSREGISLLGCLVQGMVTDFGDEMHCQFLEILRILLDGFAANTAAQCRAVIEVFYEKHLDKLIDAVESSCLPKSIAQSISGSIGIGTRVEEHSAKPEILSNICELLCFCVVHHPYKIKLNFFTSNSMEKILTLTCRRERILVVGAVRFMRTIIGRNDELLIGHVIKFNLLKPIIEAFVENGDRYNMLHSGVLELLEYIRKENLKSLVVYVAESFWNQLVKFERLGSIRAFKLRYEQLMESAETITTSVVHMRTNAEERGPHKEEEEYFNKDRNEEDSATRMTCAQQQAIVKLANGSEIHHIPARSKSGCLVHDDDNHKDSSSSPKRPLKADEGNDALNIPMARCSPLDDKNTDVKGPKKPKLEARITFAEIGVVVNVADRHPDFEDKQSLPSPTTSMKNSEGNDDSGERNPGSRNQQHAPESMNSAHETRDDCSKATGNLSPEMTVNTTKATDLEPYTAR